jgi:putative transposase
LQKRGFALNHKRVLRMMREDNLLCVRRRAFVVTTDSRHNLPVHPNLARQMRPTAVNQLWVADITYIRLRTEFVYLAVILDAFSRRVIGWALGRTLEAELALAALRMALVERKPAPGLVHHSDRGVQYASQAYTEILKQHHAEISMSRKGNPYDKDYVSYCTSWVLCATTSFTRRRLDSFTPCAFGGGWLPGCSNRQSFLSL